jgi:hypothetical protein
MICINMFLFTSCMLSITDAFALHASSNANEIVPSSDRVIKLWLNLCLYIISLLFDIALYMFILQRLSWTYRLVHGNFAVQIQSAGKHRREKARFCACRKFSFSRDIDVNGDLIATLIYNYLP